MRGRVEENLGSFSSWEALILPCGLSFVFLEWKGCVMSKGRLFVVFLMCTGLVTMMACGGGGGGGDSSLPQSSASYLGSSMPSVIDSTTADDYSDLPEWIWDELQNELQGWSPFAGPVGEDRGEGDIDGFYIDSWNYSSGSTTTTWFYNALERTEYNNYRNSTGIMRGDGSYYWKLEESGITDGLTLTDALGSDLSEDWLYHTNMNDFIESTDSWAEQTSGWITINGSADYEAGTWSAEGDANYSFRDLAIDYDYALLNTMLDAAYDGTTSTLTGSGTYCDEGTGSYYDGCFDWSMDLTFDCDIEEFETIGCSPLGIVTVSNDTVSAEFDWDGLWCYDYTVDIGKDGSIEFGPTEMCVPQ